jgi:acetyltransferase-like isoleucine patch superfamily enzyme
VVIIGNSGAARECYWLLPEMLKTREDLYFKGFLAFEGYKGDLRDLASFALGSDDDYVSEAGDLFVIGMGLPALRLGAFRKWKARGARFLNLIHPSVILVGNAALGEGNILASGVYISCGAELGDANYLNGRVIIGHDARVGDGNFFGPCSLVLGGARIGGGNSFGVQAAVLAGAKIGDGNTIAPGAYVYKGCGDGRVLAGNPALDIS